MVPNDGSSLYCLEQQAAGEDMAPNEKCENKMQNNIPLRSEELGLQNPVQDSTQPQSAGTGHHAEGFMRSRKECMSPKHKRQEPLSVTRLSIDSSDQKQTIAIWQVLSCMFSIQNVRLR